MRDQDETRALELAAAYLEAKDARGYDWRCVPASPNLLSPHNGDRKVYTNGR
jgi:hypothetical protein